MSKVISKVMSFWNRLGEPDVEEEIDIQTSPMRDELRQELMSSLRRTDVMEQGLKNSSSNNASANGGKGNSIVPRVETDSKAAMKKAEQKASQREAAERENEK